MSDSASARVAWLRSKAPRTALVVVRAPAFFTPRMLMHRCSASNTTMTPWGCSCSMSVSAICEVRRYCTCGRFANTSTRRASFDRPQMRPSAAGMYATCAMPKNGTRWCSHIE